MSIPNKDDILRQLKTELQHREEFLGTMISQRENLSAGGYDSDIFDQAIPFCKDDLAKVKSVIARFEDDEGNRIN